MYIFAEIVMETKVEVGTGFNNLGLSHEFCDILEFIKI